MSIAVPRSGVLNPVCSQTGVRLVAFPGGKAKRAEKDGRP